VEKIHQNVIRLQHFLGHLNKSGILTGRHAQAFTPRNPHTFRPEVNKHNLASILAVPR